ncbi:prominin-like protein isoform X2 [Drosophila montana]|uniref:prominin-like protein isoform X2 n=1 Tax=Drosophila montana TaxID=40370 RepID=UPI00313DD47C
MTHVARSSREIFPKIRRGRYMMKFLVMVIILVVAINAPLPATADWEKGDGDFGTQHEKAGRGHFAFVEYTMYENKVNYSVDPTYHSLYMRPIHELTHIIFGDELNIPSGYTTTAKNSSSVQLGPKVHSNQWKDLLAKNKLLIVWILLILSIIIILPFLAVCYFCFCCCRCPNVCPPCTHSSYAAKRTCCSILMLLLLLGILMGLLIAFLNEKLIHRGLREGIENMHRQAEDTCLFLKDACNHINHLFVYNFEELETSLTASINATLELIFSSMPKALQLLKKAESFKKSLIFNIAQYRDALRGVKRDITYLHTVWCDYQECNNFIRDNKIPMWGTKECLHVDKLPNITRYVEAIEDIIKKEVVVSVRRGLERFQKVDKMIQDVIDPQIPPLLTKISRVGGAVKAHGENVCKIINSIINDIYFQNARITQSFGDFNNTYGPDRKIISVILFLLIFAIIIVMFVAFICGCCIRRDNTGYKCLLLAIALIFFFLSLLLLAMLFYFILGMIMYYGVCLPSTYQEKQNLFNVIELYESEQKVQEWSRLAITCRENQSIFDALLEYELVDLNTIRDDIARNISNVDVATAVQADLSKVKILEEKDIIKITNAQIGNLSDYHSRLATDHLCTQISTIDNIVEFRKYYYQWNKNFFHTQKHDKNMNYRLWATYPSIWRLGLDLDNIILIEPNILKDMEKFKSRLLSTDKLITRNDNDFNNTIKAIMDSISKAEEFIVNRGSDYINTLFENLTEVVNVELNNYVNYLIKESNTNVGPCQSLAYMYRHSAEMVCERIVDPINGLWLGLLLCALLLLPLLFVAHRLLCLYRVHGHGRAAGVMSLNRDGVNCPTCTGIPYKPPAVVICDGGQNAYCPCPDTNKSDGNALKKKQA